MEFHPSYARAVVRASGASENPSPAPSARIVVPEASDTCVPVNAFRPRSSSSVTPRLINLERRAKFGRVDFVTA